VEPVLGPIPTCTSTSIPWFLNTRAHDIPDTSPNYLIMSNPSARGVDVTGRVKGFGEDGGGVGGVAIGFCRVEEDAIVEAEGGQPAGIWNSRRRGEVREGVAAAEKGHVELA